MKFEDMYVCDCAGCGRVMLSQRHATLLSQLSTKRRRELPPLVAGRILDRPYCDECLAIKQPAEESRKPTAEFLKLLDEVQDG